MAALGIISAIVTPAMRVAVEFTPASTAPDHYHVTASPAGAVHDPVVGTGSGPVIVVGPLRAGIVYTLVVTSRTALDAVVATGASSTATTTIECTAGAVLRQVLTDLVAARVTALGSRAVTVLTDKYKRPRTIYENEPLGRLCPIVEVAHPSLGGYGRQTEAVITESYKVEFTMLEAVKPGCHDEALESAQLLADKVRHAVDLHLWGALAGICETGWSWAAGETIYDDQVVAQRMLLTIPTRATRGCLPYSG